MDEQDLLAASLIGGPPPTFQRGPAVAPPMQQPPAAAPPPAQQPPQQQQEGEPLTRAFVDSLQRSRQLQDQGIAAGQREQQMQMGAINEYAQGSQSDIRTALSRMQPIQRFQAQDVSQSASVWMLAMTGLAGFIGARGRNAATNAMTALGGGVTGFVKGNAEQSDRALKEFKANSEAAIAQNDQEWKALKAVLDNRGTTFEARMAMAKVVGSQFANAITYEAANRGDIKMLADLVAKQEANGRAVEAHTQKMLLGAEQIKEHREKAEASHQANVENLMPVTAEDIARMERHLQDPNLDPYHKATMQEAIKNAKEGNVAGHDRRAADAAAEMYVQLGPKSLPPMARGNSPVARAQMRYRNYVETLGIQKAEERGLDSETLAENWRLAGNAAPWFKGPEGRQTRSIGTVMGHLDLARELGEVWRAGNLNISNELRARIETATGKSAPTNIVAVAQFLGPELVRAAADVGAGDADARKKMSDLFSTAKGPQQYFGAVHIAEDLVAKRAAALERSAQVQQVPQRLFRQLMGEDYYARIHKSAEGTPRVPGAGPPKDLPRKDYEDAMKAINSGRWTREQVIRKLQSENYDTRGIP